MTTFLKKIESKINSELGPEKISLIDNSNLHTRHKSFDPNKYHLKLVIKSEKLNKMKKIAINTSLFFIFNFYFFLLFGLS